MKLLFIITAVFEGITGVALLVAPHAFISLLLGTAPDGEIALLVGRVLGAALVTIAVICSKARSEYGNTSVGVLAGLLFYNLAAAVIFVYAAVRLGMYSPLLWAAIVGHFALGMWSLAILARQFRRETSR